MRYFKHKELFNYIYVSSSNPEIISIYISRGYIEITKEEFDKVKTIPNLAQDNINHQIFQNAETALRKEKQRYQNTLFTEATIAGNTVRVLTDANKIKYNEFNAFLKEQADVELQRAEEYYNLMVNGSTSAHAVEMISKVKVQGVHALQGRNDFIAWLQVEHPTLVTYLSNTNSLNYSTFLTEDEPE